MSNDRPLTAVEVALELHKNNTDQIFHIASIFAGLLVSKGVLTKDELADAFEGSELETLHSFGRTIRMNFPGGRFEVIEGGKSDQPVG